MKLVQGLVRVSTSCARLFARLPEKKQLPHPSTTLKKEESVSVAAEHSVSKLLGIESLEEVERLHKELGAALKMLKADPSDRLIERVRTLMHLLGGGHAPDW